VEIHISFPKIKEYTFTAFIVNGCWIKGNPIISSRWKLSNNLNNCLRYKILFQYRKRADDNFWNFDRTAIYCTYIWVWGFVNCTFSFDIQGKSIFAWISLIMGVIVRLLLLWFTFGNEVMGYQILHYGLQ
jgi:hypothetical protein